MAESVHIRGSTFRIEQQSQFVTNLVMGMNKVIVVQKHLVDCLLIGLLQRWPHPARRRTWSGEDLGHQDPLSAYQR